MNLVEKERKKYEHVWSFREYHDHSPGERLAPYFVQHVPFQKGESVIDLGCGTARAARTLQRAGLQVFLLDHVNAVDPTIHLPFISANLWEMPKLTGFDWFYCCDVMEHIPPEMVDRVLDNCAAISTKGGFFQIALFGDDRWGETLHLTIESSGWWVEKLQARWPKVIIDEPEKRRIVAIVTK